MFEFSVHGTYIFMNIIHDFDVNQVDPTGFWSILEHEYASIFITRYTVSGKF